jgi:hypothetical protein
VIWVHVFEEDTPEGAVFRPIDADIPLSRRPRERLELRDDGSAVLLTGGPDDRPVAQEARWKEEGGQIVVRSRGAVRLRIKEQSDDRLLVDLAGLTRK